MSSIFTSPYQSTPMVWSAQGGVISWMETQGGSDPLMDLGGIAAGGPNTTLANILATVDLIDIRAQRQVRTQYPISDQNAFILVGAPSVTVQIRNLFGPTDKLLEFIEVFGHNCKSMSVYIKPSINDECNSGQDIPSGIFVAGLVGVSFNYQLQSGNDGMAIANGTFALQGTHILSLKL